LKYKIGTILLFFIILYSCSTKKNTGFRRSYHNLTSHYNVYFNGKESFKEGVLYLENNLTEDYSNVLNVFIYDDASSSSIGSQMQRAEKKAAKLIKIHSITARPKRKKGHKTKKDKEFYAKKEYNKWVDDAHLLMGQAFFMEKNYKSAEENFIWMLSEYPEEESRFDAQIWLARTYIQTKKFDKALDFLQRTEAEKEFPEDRLNRELFPTYADYYIKQKRYSEALPWLELALNEKGKKLYKRRYKYIIAQIYQMNGQDKKAYDMYQEVIKMRPKYEMEFSAKIEKATLFDKKTGDSKGIRKQLQKMLKDEKNIDYKDQIYYALANIDMKENLELDAINDYKLSAYTSVANNPQKGLSYLALADIYFSKLNYITAKAYYDSTIMNLSKKHPNYEEITAKSENLTELVSYAEIIQNQDSLLRLANMPEKERGKMISKIIQKIVEDEKKAAEEARQHQIDMAQYNENNRPGNNNSTAGGKWYFYNPAAIGMGQADFARKWGDRRLEDNWRRKNKTIVDFGVMADDGESVEKDSTKQKFDKKNPKYYLSQLPMSDSLQLVANQQIEEALFQLARVYREQFVDYDKSIRTYEELLKRYPKTEYELDAWFQLYQLHELQKQPDKSTKYKQSILEKYPESIPAKILSDPNYLAKQEAEKNKTKGIYAKAFQSFQNRKFTKVIKYCDHVEKNNPETPLMPKFLILKAQSIGAKGNVDEMKNTLTKVKKDYPKTEEQELADFMLSRIESGGYTNFVVDGETAYVAKEGQTTNSNNVNTSAPDSSSVDDNIDEEIAPENIYVFNPEIPHQYMMAATGEISDLNRLKFNIVKYNLNQFLMFDFKVADRKLTSDTKLILVKPLNDAKEAYKYLKLIRKNTDVYSEFSSLKMQQFIITEGNLKILMKDKNIDRYLMFFKQSYESK